MQKRVSVEQWGRQQPREPHSVNSGSGAQRFARNLSLVLPERWRLETSAPRQSRIITPRSAYLIRRRRQGVVRRGKPEPKRPAPAHGRPEVLRLVRKEVDIWARGYPHRPLVRMRGARNACGCREPAHLGGIYQPIRADRACDLWPDLGSAGDFRT